MSIKKLVNYIILYSRLNSKIIKSNNVNCPPIKKMIYCHYQPTVAAIL